MGMPRLINHKRFSFAVKCFIFASLTSAIVLIAKYKISTVNEQWRVSGEDVLEALQKKCDWLTTNMNPSSDADDLETILNGIMQRQENKENISQGTVDLTCKITKNEFRHEATNIANKWKEIHAELTDVQHKLSVLSAEGTKIMIQLRESADSRTGKALKEIRSEADKSYSTLRQICDRRIVISPDYKEAVGDCNRITELIAANQTGDNDWMQLEKKHDDYINWKKTVIELLNHFEECNHALKDNFQKLNNFPLDRQYVQDMVQEQISEEQKIFEPILEMENELYENFVKRLNNELEKRKLRVQNIFDSISRLKEQHGDFVDAENMASARRMIDLFKNFCHSTQENLNRQWQIIRENISNAKLIKEKTTNTFIPLLQNSNEISDDQIMKKYEDTLEYVRELQMARKELMNHIEALKEYIDEKLSLSTKNVDEMNVLLKRVDQSLPDWTVEGRKINDDIAKIQQQLKMIEEKMANIRKEIVNCQDNGAQGEKALLLVMYNETQNALAEIKTINASERPCTNGIELMKHKEKRDEMNNRINRAKDKFQNLVNEYENALKLGKICKIKYMPFSNSIMASQLHEAYKNMQINNENAVCHFDLSLDVPTGGYHKVEIRFWKDKKSLYKISRGKDHYVIINYKISGLKNKSDVLTCLDKTNKSGGESTERWPSIEIDSVLESGINDMGLDLSFKAEDIKKSTLFDGEWQFQYEETKGIFNSNTNNKDNFFMEVLIDGNVAKLLMRVKDQ